MTLRLTVLASGRGSNFVAIHDAILAGRCRAEIAGVVTDRASAPVLELAEERGIKTSVVPFRRHERADWERELLEVVRAQNAPWVVLAGFMRVLSASFVEAYERRMVNVHPSLLPSFPGMHAVQQAIDAGVRISGCTVHLVDAGVDTGPILAQAAVPVHDGDDADALHARIRGCEHRLLAATLDAIASERLQVDPLRWTRANWPASLESPVVAS